MLKIKDIIEKLQELKDDDYVINFEVEPLIKCYEDFNGDGIEETTYIYTITLKQKPIIRKYKNKCGIKKYIGKEYGIKEFIEKK